MMTKKTMWFQMKRTKSNLMKNNKDLNNCQRSMTTFKSRIILKKFLNLMTFCLKTKTRWLSSMMYLKDCISNSKTEIKIMTKKNT